MIRKIQSKTPDNRTKMGVFLPHMGENGAKKRPPTANAEREEEGGVEEGGVEEQEQESATFLHAMDRLGVTPLATKRRHTPSPPTAQQPTKHALKTQPKVDVPASVPAQPPAQPLSASSNTSNHTPPNGASRAPSPHPIETDWVAAFDAMPWRPRQKFEGAPSSPPPTRPRPSKKRKHTNQPQPEGQIDLHGLTADQALQKLTQFIAKSQQSRFNTVLCITGKGLHSGPGGEVLRSQTQAWLQAAVQQGRICQFTQAPPALGGGGAFVVEIAAQRKSAD